ncbi:hypothetical protein E2562_036427 [Oryza meyeriana var. granulata]|uniref:Uncharacterized protein n=1 Tax=Oryza meyeriana var. granulata TaxID=110450 RepID=A0A6G1BQK6_9ORYZ|nr:hypothetical protein E2562_036427 [Oryza meyeriana var. granulata]
MKHTIVGPEHELQPRDLQARLQIYRYDATNDGSWRGRMGREPQGPPQSQSPHSKTGAEEDWQ